VAAHAHGDEGAYAAVKAGVRSIEHGTYLSDKTLALMQLKKTYLVPTFTANDQPPADPKLIDNPILAERNRIFKPLRNKMTNRAYKMHIRIIAGTDVRYSVPGLTIATEAIYLQKAGLLPMEVIQSMTYRSAQCLGIDGRTGAIKKGLEADLVILGKNPLESLENLKGIIMVINDGKIAINQLH
jgi:imidazolonepropionase-like amidohydrolase